jgi:hypothetical protein
MLRRKCIHNGLHSLHSSQILFISQIKKDEVGIACSACRRDEGCIQNFGWGNLEGRELSAGQGID